MLKGTLQEAWQEIVQQGMSIIQLPGGRRAVTMSDAYAYSGGGGGKLKLKGVKDGKVDKRKRKKYKKPAPSSNGGDVEGENVVGEDK